MTGRLAAVVVAALVAAPAALAVSPDDSLAVATRLKPELQHSYAPYGVAIGKVTCSLPRSGTIAHCTARFAISSSRLLGSFQVKAHLDAKRKLHWTALSVRCTHARTGKPAICLT